MQLVKSLGAHVMDALELEDLQKSSSDTRIIRRECMRRMHRHGYNGQLRTRLRLEEPAERRDEEV